MGTTLRDDGRSRHVSMRRWLTGAMIVSLCVALWTDRALAQPSAAGGPPPSYFMQSPPAPPLPSAGGGAPLQYPPPGGPGTPGSGFDPTRSGGDGPPLGPPPFPPSGRPGGPSFPVPPFDPRRGPGFGPAMGPARQIDESLYLAACRRLAQMKNDPQTTQAVELVLANQPAIAWDPGLRHKMSLAALPTEKIPSFVPASITKEMIVSARADLKKIGLIALLRDKSFRRALLILTWKTGFFQALQLHEAEADRWLARRHTGEKARVCCAGMAELQSALTRYTKDHPKEPTPWTIAPQCQDKLARTHYLKEFHEVCPSDGRPLRLERAAGGPWTVRCDTHGTHDRPSAAGTADDEKLAAVNPFVWVHTRKGSKTGAK